MLSSYASTWIRQEYQRRAPYRPHATTVRIGPVWLFDIFFLFFLFSTSLDANTPLNKKKLYFQAQYLIFEKMREEGYVSGTEDVRLTIEILVPSAQVGRIIGKGGQNVRELQRVTGSVIKLSEQQATPPSADEETTVHIIGPFFSVQVN